MPVASILRLPLDSSSTFRATRLVYIKPLDLFSREIAVTDAITVLEEQGFHNSSAITPELLEAAKNTSCRLRSSQPGPSGSVRASESGEEEWGTGSRTRLLHSLDPSMMTLKAVGRLMGAHTVLLDADGTTELATIYSDVLGYGAAQIKFPAGAHHHSHPIALTPVHIGRRALRFVLESAECAWEATERFKAGRMRLVRAANGCKAEIARFESSTGGFRLEGILFVDTGPDASENDELGGSSGGAGSRRTGVSVVTALSTLVAVFKQRDGFYMPGLDLSRRK